ncbi:hypothetical protein Agub_g4883, partial [Astrephomene gubernaculifera]
LSSMLLTPKQSCVNAPARPHRGRTALLALAFQPIHNSNRRAPVQLTEAASFVTAIFVFATAPSAYAFTNCTPAQHPSTNADPLLRQEKKAAVSTVKGANPVADLGAGLFGGGGDFHDERDPITPFTLYGTNSKKFLIEELQGNKIVGRRRGFTVEACVGAVEAPEETPQFQGLSTRDKALYAEGRTCKKSEGQELRETCRVACETACSEAVAGQAARVAGESGFRLLAADQVRLARGCARSCTYECGKPGSNFDFVVPYRR